MNKLDKQIQKIINTDIFFAQNEEEYAKALSKIKQSILKAIMDAKPEREPTMKPEEWAMGYEYGIEEFESVIKEVLTK